MIGNTKFDCWKGSLENVMKARVRCVQHSVAYLEIFKNIVKISKIVKQTKVNNEVLKEICATNFVWPQFRQETPRGDVLLDL